MKKALVLSLVLVLGLGVASFGQTLTGKWDTTITIVPTPVSLAIKSTLLVDYTVSGWSFASSSTFTQTGWDAQKFTVDGSLGAFVLVSTLTFTPMTPAFKSWVVTSGVDIVGVSFDAVFTLTPGVTKLVLSGAGKAGLVGVAVDVTLGSGLACDFDFAGVVATVDFPFNCANIEAVVTFDCLGFVSATFEATNIAIPTLPWVTLDALLTFQTGSKTLVLTPTFDFGPIACFNLYIDQVDTGTGPLELGNIIISGIGLDVTIGGVDFLGLSYWGANGDKPGLLHDTPYWEVYQISTSEDGCCGGKFGFKVGVFFDADSAWLFDVSLLKADMSVNVTSNFVFSTGISIDLAHTPSFTLWTIGFAVTW
jgi:hypothetical protein